VIVIISILLGFILKAGLQAVRAAQLRQTQTLITKLETALNDRLDALTQTRPDPNTAHLYMAKIFNSNSSQPMAGYLRAQTIAWYDYMKSEMPDTFFVQNTSGPYPVNFAGNPYPGNPTDGSLSLGNYILPLGNSVQAPYGDGNGSGYSPTAALGLANNPAGTGIYGASYAAAAGIYKNLGYLPTGYDGVDNNQNGYIDEWAEGVNASNSGLVQTHLGNHTHNTARSEVLYAILVEGRGPLGSVFNKDDFTDREVADTDNDGLPEFIDAWGNPLQFFRWPLLYHSPIQRGQQIVQANVGGVVSWTLLPPYQNTADTTSGLQYLNGLQERELDPLDVNQQLVAPAWWSGGYNNASPFSTPGTASSAFGASGSAQAFEYYFHRLTEPYPNAGGPMFWDRGSTYGGRRSYYSKFLILSGGPDNQPGVFLYSNADMAAYGANASWPLIANENLALPFSASSVANGFVDFTQSGTYSTETILYSPSIDLTRPSSSDLLQSAQDDITNQGMAGIGGGG
jgi:hypothetical protein